jgi:hypothetical protein
MPAAIPVEVKTICSMLNLPDELSGKPIFDEHQGLVLRHLERIAQPAALKDAFEELTEDDPIFIAFRFGYAFLMLASVVEFLNLKTLGEGIVKTTGFDAQSTELLTGAEVDAFKVTLEHRALETLSEYLNPVGRNRLDALCDRVGRRVRAVVI